MTERVLQRAGSSSDTLVIIAVAADNCACAHVCVRVCRCVVYRVSCIVDKCVRVEVKSDVDVLFFCTGCACCESNWYICQRIRDFIHDEGLFSLLTMRRPESRSGNRKREGPRIAVNRRASKLKVHLWRGASDDLHQSQFYAKSQNDAAPAVSLPRCSRAWRRCYWREVRVHFNIRQMCLKQNDQAVPVNGNRDQERSV